MADLDELSRRTATLVTTLARKGMSVATGVAVVVLVIGGLSYLTGLAMLVVAVGAPLLARWRLSSVLRRTTELVGDIRTLITRDADAQRVVIETVAVEEPLPNDVRDLRPVLYDSRQFGRLRTVTVRADDLKELPAAMRAVTTFPLLLAIALLGVVVFGILGFLFSVAWIL